MYGADHNYPTTNHNYPHTTLHCYKLFFFRIVEPAIDHWEPRVGIAVALYKICPFFNDFMVTQAISFFIPKGLGDRNDCHIKLLLIF